MKLTEIVDPTVLSDLLPKEAGKFITNRKQILAWIKKFKIDVAGIKIEEDGIINAARVIQPAFETKNLTHFPVQWGNIIGAFDFGGNQGSLRTLIGGPKTVGRYDVSSNQIYSLEGCPEKVNGTFNIDNNRLSSLMHSPKHVVSDFICSNNRLTSLEHGPTLVEGGYYCVNNKLTSLKGLPSKINGSFSCMNNLLTESCIHDFPTEVEGWFTITGNKFTSLKGIDKYLKKINGSIDIGTNPITSHILGLMRIEGLTSIDTEGNGNVSDLYIAAKIINEHLGQGKAGIIDAQTKLIAAGLDDFAQF